MRIHSTEVTVVLGFFFFNASFYMQKPPFCVFVHTYKSYFVHETKL